MLGSLKEINKKKSFFFCVSYVNIFFTIFIGIFLNIFIVFLTLSAIFFKPIYSQTTLFSFSGIMFFVVSRRMFLKKYGPNLKHLNYESFLISRNKLFFWISWTFNFYLIFCWISLIFLGSTNGLGINYPINNTPALVTEEAGSMKLIGLSLSLVHIFLLIIVKVVVYYWSRIFAFAHSEFEKRRKNLSLVRDKAQLES